MDASRGTWWGSPRAIFRSYRAEHLAFLAAGLSYYAFFSIFPLMLVLIAVAGQFLTAHEAMRLVLDVLGEAAPHQKAWIAPALQAVVEHRTSAGLAGFIALLWAARAAFQSLSHAMNRIWGVPDRPWLKDNALALSAALLAGVLVAGTAAIIALTRTFLVAPLRGVGLDTSVFQPMAGPLAQATPPLMTFVLLTVLYTWLPNRSLSPRQVWRAAVAATVAWEGLSLGFGWYVTHVTDLSWVYGSLGSVVGFLLWLYASANVFLTGVVLARHLEEGTNQPS